MVQNDVSNNSETSKEFSLHQYIYNTFAKYQSSKFSHLTSSYQQMSATFT